MNATSIGVIASSYKAVVPPAFSIVQTTTQVTNASASTLNISLSATGLNNLVVLHVYFITVAGDTLTSVTDNVGNVYVLGAGVSSGSGFGKLYQVYGVQTIAGATSITANISGSVTLFLGVDEYTGTAHTNAGTFDVRTSNNGSGTSLDVATLTPSSAGELIIASSGANSPSTWTAGLGYTLYSGNGQEPTNLRSEYKIVGTTSETAPMSVVGAVDWIEIAAAFKQ